MCIHLAVAAVLGWLATAHHAAAETPTEMKIRLMADALRARDAGELERAKELAAELVAAVPNDANARRFLREIETLIVAREEAARNPPPPPMQDVRIPEAPSRPSPAPAESREDAARATDGSRDIDVDLQAEAEAIAREETRRIARLLAEAPKQRQRARDLAAKRRYDEALAVLADALAALPLNPLTRSTVAELEAERSSIESQRAEAEAKRGGRRSSGRVPNEPRTRVTGADSEASAQSDEIEQRIARARSHELSGDRESALAAYRAAEDLDPARPEVRRFFERIEREQARTGTSDREQTRSELIEQVSRSWQRRPVQGPRPESAQGSPATEPLARKLQEIVLPSVSFTRTEIGQVVAALSAIAEEYDRTEAGGKGVNVVLIDPSHQKPTVTLTLRNTSLKRVLDFVTESIGYQYELQPDAVVVRPGGDATVLDTEFFPIGRATVLRMAGTNASVGAVAVRSDFPSSAGAANIPAESVTGTEGPAIKAFLQQAGVAFDSVPGSSLAFDGSALIVTQTPRNLDRIRNLLVRYNDVRQVEIEAKFIEVQEGALEELGVNWTIGTKETQRNAGARATYQTGGRSLGSAFGSSNGVQQGRIVRPALPTLFDDANGNGALDPGETVIQDGQSGIDQPIVNNAPRLPGAAELAAAAAPLANITGVIGEFDVNAVVRALSQKQGTDLLSAPKVTVLSGNPATITVAQEMRYPQSFGQTQSQVGTGNASGGGSAGVAITAGTPQEFTKRNVGVELRVTPTVEEDDYSISLDLNPRVTEFDGFVEYGGPSIAISGSTTVTVPSGFYQPIFSVRDISTKVTIWDGATLVMGGLTREEVKKVNDKVPILGDLPLIGRAFRSKGESAQKRNLLIFVTATLVSPGGAPKKLVEREARAMGRLQRSAVAVSE